MRLDTIRALRRLVLPLFARFNPGDIRIRHHWTPHRRVLLHSFKHRGYWYHGRRREEQIMRGFARLVREGDSIVEVGGHIGYVSIHLSHLAGPAGQVRVFEPGANNLPYIRRNLELLGNATLVEKAATDHTGRATFYLEEMTGQNNSLVPGFEVLAENEESVFLPVRVKEAFVETVRLDDYCAEENLRPTLIKIDAEGAEASVLRGAQTCLRQCRPILMVEVSRRGTEVFDLLAGHGYVALDTRFRRLPEGRRTLHNIWFLHGQAHKAELAGSGRLASGR